AEPWRTRRAFYRKSLAGRPQQSDRERHGSFMGTHWRRHRMGLEELHARAERAVYGRTAAIARVAGFGARWHGTDAGVRGKDESRGDDSFKGNFEYQLLPGE